MKKLFLHNQDSKEIVDLHIKTTLSQDQLLYLLDIAIYNDNSKRYLIPNNLKIKQSKQSTHIVIRDIILNDKNSESNKLININHGELNAFFIDFLRSVEREYVYYVHFIGILKKELIDFVQKNRL